MILKAKESDSHFQFREGKYFFHKRIRDLDTYTLIKCESPRIISFPLIHCQKTKDSKSNVYGHKTLLGSLLELTPNTSENKIPPIYPKPSGQVYSLGQQRSQSTKYDTGKANLDEKPKHFYNKFQWCSLLSLTRVKIKASTV